MRGAVEDSHTGIPERNLGHIVIEADALIARTELSCFSPDSGIKLYSQWHQELSGYVYTEAELGSKTTL